MSTELDGKYLVSTVSNYNGPIERRSDGETEIVDGQTKRIDDNKVKWTSTFEIVSDTEVKMTSVADPTDAVSDFGLMTPQGRLTRRPMTYESILKMARRGNEIRMSGQIEIGDEIVFLTMRSIVED